MKIKTSELEGAALDWAVGISINGNPIMTEIYGANILGRSIQREVEEGRMRPSTDWSQGGPLIDRYDIRIDVLDDGAIDAACPVERDGLSVITLTSYRGETRLISAMRAIVASEIGDEVDIPDELLED